MHLITKIFSYCFDEWWKPLLLFGLASVLLLISNGIENNSFWIASLIFFLISLGALLVSAIYQLTKRQWVKAIVTGFILGLTVALIFLYSFIIIFRETVDRDRWADNLKIPDNISLNLPKGNQLSFSKPDSISNLPRTSMDFELYNSFQPGLYQYDFWTGKIESGIIFLKAFEITQEYPLSTDRLEDASAINVSNATNDIVKFANNSEFTIYEGDWGKPYAARFEVWFKPKEGGKQRKLIEKIYKIEGWQP